MYKYCILQTRAGIATSVLHSEFNDAASKRNNENPAKEMCLNICNGNENPIVVALAVIIHVYMHVYIICCTFKYIRTGLVYDDLS